MLTKPALKNMKQILLFFILTPCLIATLPVFSEEVPAKAPLTLNTLIKEVIERNPDLSAVRERIKAAQIASSRAKVLEDPKLSIMTENTPFKKDSELNTMIRYEIVQEFPFPGKRALSKKIAEQSVEIVRAEELTTVLELTLQAKKIYYELFFNRAERRINEKNRDVIRRFVDGATFRYKTGIGEYHEVLKAQVEYEMLQSEYLSLDQERKSMMAMLNAILDLPPMTEAGEPVEAFTPAQEFKYEELEKTAMQNRPELSGMQAMIVEQKIMADMARREFYPDFMMSGLFQQGTGDMDNAWGVGIGISLPIWIEKKQRSGLREAESRASAFESSLRGMRAMIRAQIQDSIIKVQNAEQRISLYKESIIPSALQTLESIESKYRAGKENFIMLLDTRRQLQEIELSYERARVEREEFIAGLERAVGTEFEKAEHME